MVQVKSATARHSFRRNDDVQNLGKSMSKQPEAFGLDRLEANARQLAQSIELTKYTNRSLLRRFADSVGSR